LLLFSLSGFPCDVLNRYALSRVHGHTLRQRHELRHVQSTDEIVVDFKLLRFVLTRALRLMNNNLFNKFVYDGRVSSSISVYFFIVRKKLAALLLCRFSASISACMAEIFFLSEICSSS
jgi:hypothetical protein